MANVLGREPPIPRLNKEGRWVVRVKSKTFVEHCERCIAVFLRGFFDSEGCVSTNGQIFVDNTDYALLTHVLYL
ncbi:hypothetical protein HRbin02_00764 [Candidatus Calditenuaceae archaeon HR02]|nr:hypothetical protein HRbin02_00764 [Candidatus Calditenuaceae archaeon HR02]